MNKYRIEYTTKFKKSYRKIIQQQRNLEDEFKKVIEMLASDRALPEKYHNHLLESKSNRNMGMPYKT